MSTKYSPEHVSSGEQSNAFFIAHLILASGSNRLLGSLAITFFSSVAAAYDGTLITIAAWYGGTVARAEKTG